MSESSPSANEFVRFLYAGFLSVVALVLIDAGKRNNSRPDESFGGSNPFRSAGSSGKEQPDRDFIASRIKNLSNWTGY